MNPLPRPSIDRPIIALAALLLAGLTAAPLALATPQSWKDDIAQFEKTDAARPPPQGAVLFVGSSSIRLWTTLAKDFPGIATINRGFGGSELADSVFYADRIVLPYHPRLVVLYAGDNDLWAGKTPEQVLTDFRAFRTKVLAALPETRIIYLSVKESPSRTKVRAAVRTTNRLIAADCAANPRCEFVDVDTPLLAPGGALRPELFRDDQLHLSPAGYAIWTRVLAPHLEP
ncbi:MAG TPA: SGNH/GDSL hydrolase family protein [Opitutaceae bacterium]|nr:SGNH/GDSL hydrolase family protein [Opitutaceae bacterium]